MRRKKCTAFLCTVSVLLLLCACGSRSQIESTNSTTDLPVSMIEAESKVNESAYTVTFYADDSSVLCIDTVKAGESATPPAEPQMTYGNVFMKWDKDFSAISEVVKVFPECQSVTGKKNVFALESAYGRKEETIVVPFRLCGDVYLCGFDLTVHYDADKLELESVFHEDGDVIFNDETTGEIYLNFASIENVKADVDICWFKFRIIADSGEVPVFVTMNSVYVGAEDDEMLVPEYELISANVYIYQ